MRRERKPILIEHWCQARPAITSYFKLLNDQHVRWAFLRKAGLELSL